VEVADEPGERRWVADEAPARFPGVGPAMTDVNPRI
jgi:hypothetical protein